MGDVRIFWREIRDMEDAPSRRGPGPNRDKHLASNDRQRRDPITKEWRPHSRSVRQYRILLQDTRILPLDSYEPSRRGSVQRRRCSASRTRIYGIESLGVENAHYEADGSPHVTQFTSKPIPCVLHHCVADVWGRISLFRWIVRKR